MMRIAVSGAVAFLVFAGAYLVLSRKLAAREATDYREYLVEQLDQMFFRVNDHFVGRVIVISVLLCGFVGFWLPGGISTLGRLTIDEAVSLNKAGKYDDALKVLEKLRGLDSPLVHNELGVAYLGAYNLEWARNEFQEALAILPEYSKAHANLGTVYLLEGKPREAAFSFAKAKESSQAKYTEAEIYGLGLGWTKALIARLFLAGLGGLLGYRLPRWIVAWIRGRRVKRFDDQLPDGLVMASNALRAGFSLLQAMDLVAKETPAPLSQEFQLVLKEHRLGAELEDAVRHLYDRMPTADTKIFVNALLILRETGGNLTEIFDRLAETVRERKRVEKKIRTMTAEGESQAVILALLPVVLGLLLNQVNPEFFELMYTTVLGWMLLILMGVMEAFGIVWMLKLVKVKV